MLREEPRDRPTADQALENFQQSVRHLAPSFLRRKMFYKIEWTEYEIRFGIKALLNGEGDERVLFPQLQDPESKVTKVSFKQGSLKEKFRILRRVFRLYLRASTGPVLDILAWEK